MSILVNESRLALFSFVVWAWSLTRAQLYFTFPLHEMFLESQTFMISYISPPLIVFVRKFYLVCSPLNPLNIKRKKEKQ
jgi:hypothetical protein